MTHTCVERNVHVIAVVVVVHARVLLSLRSRYSFCERRMMLALVGR